MTPTQLATSMIAALGLSFVASLAIADQHAPRPHDPAKAVIAPADPAD